MAFIPKYIIILAVTIMVDYLAGIGLEKVQGNQRRWLLIASILTNIGMLGFFKYFNFANENIVSLAKFIGWNYPLQNLSIILPIGLSFHTFQSLSYTIEVYRGHQKAERHLGYLALYVMYYPQLVAGPIERPQNVLHQLHAEHHFEYKRVTDGLKWMAWGMFKKTVIADHLLLFVNPIYNDPTHHQGPALVLATFAFAIQIYCDFSGYSDIALGSAQVMGVKLMKNFDHPYFSRSISEFWGRWHISLSTWFRDYLYIPLGGNRVSKIRWVFNILITFLVSGLWHGANWTYVIWGALHGLYFVCSDLMHPLTKKVSTLFTAGNLERLRTAVSTLITFFAVTFAWIFFRAKSITDALYIAGHLHSGWGPFIKEAWSALLHGVRQMTLYGIYPTIDSLFKVIKTITDESRASIVVSVLMLLVLFVIEIMQYRENLLEKLDMQPRLARYLIYVSILMALLIFGANYENGQHDFIYFQF